MWEEWSQPPSGTQIASIGLLLAWEVRAEYPFEREGFAVTGKGGPSGLVAVRTLAGEGRFQLDSDRFVNTSAGDVLFFERRFLHRYSCQTPQWHYWWFKFSAVGPLRIPLGQSLTVGFHPTDVASMRHIFENLSHPLAERRFLSSASFVRLVYEWMDRWRSGRTPPEAQTSVRQVVEMMQKHLDGNLSVEQMAEAISVCPRRLHQLFRNVVGIGPKKYYDQLRLQRAEMLLRDPALRISQVSTRLGFDDPLYFSRWIRRRTGVPPTQWRQSPPSE